MQGETHVRVVARAVVALSLLLLAGTLTPAKNRKGVEADLEVGADLEYTDNLFHFSEEDIDEFHTAQAPGQKFFDLEEPEDIILSLGVGGDWRFDRGKGRDLRLGAGGTYHAHVQNDIADYPEFDLLAAYDITKRDRIRGDANIIVDRFRKNLRVANTATYVPAEYDQVALTAGYERAIRKRWSAGGELQFRDRTYDDALQARDQDGVYVGGFTGYRIREHFWGESQLDFGSVDTDSELDAGILIDRSYDQYRVEQGFRWKLPAEFEIEAGLELRRRDYTTNETADLGRYSREDDRFELNLGLLKELGKDLVLDGRLTLRDNDSSRIDPAVDTDEAGYEETAVMVRLRYTR